MKTSRSAVPRALAPRLLGAMLALGAAAGCQSITDLDETSETFISPDRFYRNDEQAAIAVNGVYAPLMGWNGWKQPAQHSVMCDDNEMLCWNWMGGGFSGNHASQWYNQDNSVWFGDYQMIQRANEVVANVAASSGISEGMKARATGQALFARGYAYFDLVRRFGGVPIRLEPYVPDDQLGARERASVAEVYRQAATDLRAAAELLPASYSTVNGKGLPTAAAAWGLLAKVYLHMAGAEAGPDLAGSRTVYLDSARIAAQRVMQDATVSLEQSYMDLFDVGKQNTSPEILFAVQGARANLSGSNIPSFFAPRGDCTVVGGCGNTGFLSVREDFYRSFEEGDERVAPYTAIARKWEVTNSPLGRIDAIHTDSIDILWSKGVVVEDKQFRWESWSEGCGSFQQRYDSLTVRVAPGSSETTTRVVAVGRPVYSLKYVDRASAGGSEYATANNFIVLRHADVLLIFAEAENELNGPTGAAYAALNAVRGRADLDPLGGLSKEQFRQAVWTERAHELYGEFQARFDLLRQGRWLQVMNQGSTVPDYTGHGVCRPRQAFQKLYPIPGRELAANPLIEQNPGY